MPLNQNHCNICRRGAAEFIGHKYYDKKDLCASVYRCIECGALFEVPWQFIGSRAFDLEHPRAVTGMLPTEDYLRRKMKEWTA